MKHNVITFASILANNLSDNILSKFQLSVEDKLNQLSTKYNTSIDILHNAEGTLASSNATKYSDGSYNLSKNKWELLSQEDQEEVNYLLDIQNQNKEEAKIVIKYLLPLAFRTQEVNEKHQIISNPIDSYHLFLQCLPEAIRNDTTLLMKGNNQYQDSGVDEQDLYQILNHKMDKTKVEEFITKNHKPEVEEILLKLYALDFLMDF